LAALEDDRRVNGFMDTGLMQHLVCEKELTLDSTEARIVEGYTRILDQLHVFNFDRLFIPTNINNMHWTMIVVKMHWKEMHYYDSMSRVGTMYTNLVKACLVREMYLKKYLELNVWRVVTQEANVPQQGTNGNECGVFTMMCADFLSDNLPMTYCLDEMDFFRRKIAADILRGKLYYN
jgi:sentrin-specific protease 1